MWRRERSRGPAERCRCRPRPDRRRGRHTEAAVPTGLRWCDRRGDPSRALGRNQAKGRSQRHFVKVVLFVLWTRERRGPGSRLLSRLGLASVRCLSGPSAPTSPGRLLGGPRQVHCGCPNMPGCRVAGGIRAVAFSCFVEGGESVQLRPKPVMLLFWFVGHVSVGDTL